MKEGTIETIFWGLERWLHLPLIQGLRFNAQHSHWQLTMACNSSSSGSNALSWPLWVLHTWCTYV